MSEFQVLTTSVALITLVNSSRLDKFHRQRIIQVKSKLSIINHEGFA